MLLLLAWCCLQRAGFTAELFCKSIQPHSKESSWVLTIREGVGFNPLQRCELGFLTFTAVRVNFENSEGFCIWFESFFSPSSDSLHCNAWLQLFPFPHSPLLGSSAVEAVHCLFQGSITKLMWYCWFGPPCCSLHGRTARRTRPVLVQGCENKAWLERTLGILSERNCVLKTPKGVWMCRRGQMQGSFTLLVKGKVWMWIYIYMCVHM